MSEVVGSSYFMVSFFFLFVMTFLVSDFSYRDNGHQFVVVDGDLHLMKI